MEVTDIVSNLDVDIDYEKIKKTFQDLSIEKMLLDNERQVAIHRRKEITDPDLQLIDATRSLTHDWDNYFPEKDYNNSGPAYRTKFIEETEFDIVCDLFKGTYIEEVANILNEKYNAVRGRFMLLNWKTCLTYHNDFSMRIHIPIVTDKNCFMVIDDNVYRLPYGGTYLVNTEKKHTALNASKILRTHLVFCTNKFKSPRKKLPWED
jgi:hypothetical protein